MSLNPADLATVSRLLDEVLDLPTGEREAWLGALPADQQRHAATLRKMIARQARLETEQPLAAMPRLHEDESVAHAGDLVGPYRLLREIGRGGMGSVWLAERADGSFKRQVALKLPRLAWGAGLAERMAREREIGALLEHPNIARLYDAGVDDKGRPYLALEYIDGQPIDAWCEARRLNVRERLRLFVQVAKAVSYAHGRLVVHRDLKPSNVMVTSDGQSHLLDFGIAKLLNDAVTGAAGLTQDLGRVLTPHYASPEQVSGAPITVQSDVYSLGVLLYELLTGALPIAPRRATAGAVEEAILEGEVQLASSRVVDRSTARALHGEVDAILAKALQREPQRRYASADALAQDIERHLNGEAVVARPDSAAYRLGKALRRHWIGVTASGAVVTALSAGGGVALVQARRANDEAARAGHVRQFVLDLFDVAGGSQGQMPAKDLLERGAKSIETRFPGQPALQADLYGAVADMFSKTGNAGRAVQYRTQQVETLVAAGAPRSQVASATLMLAGTLGGGGRFKESGARMRQVLEMAGDDPRLRVEAHAGLAYALMMGQSENLPAADQELAAAEAIMAREAIPTVDRAVVLTNRADWLSRAGRVDEAGPLFDEAIRIGLAAEGPLSRRAIDARTSAAFYFARASKPARSEAYLREALQTLRAIGGPDDARAAFEEVNITLESFMRGGPSYADAKRVIEGGYAMLRPRGWVPAMSFAYLINRIQAFYLTAGDIDNATRISADVSIDRSARPTDESPQWNMLAVSSRLAAITGKPELAIRDARAALGLDQQTYQGIDLDESYELLLWALIHDRRHAEAHAALTEFEGLPGVMQALTGRAAQPASIGLARATLQLERGEILDLIRSTEQWQLDADSRRHEQAWLLRASVYCAAGRTDQGLDLFARWLPDLAERSVAASPLLMHWRARMGLCALQAGRKQQAREAFGLASAALVKQAGVSAHLKAPVLELERRLRSK